MRVMHMRAWQRASIVLLAAFGIISSVGCAGVTLGSGGGIVGPADGRGSAVSDAAGGAETALVGGSLRNIELMPTAASTPTAAAPANMITRHFRLSMGS